MIKKIKNTKAQATIELFAFIILAFAIVWFCTKHIFIPIYKAKAEGINRYNQTIKVSNNMRKFATLDGEPVSVEIRKFDVPTLGFDLGAIANALGNVLMEQFGDDLFKKLKLDSTQSWYKSAIRGGTEAFVRSGFNYNEIPWGMAYGAAASGDFANLTGRLGSVGGAGLQGAVLGGITSKGDWQYALASGVTAMWETDKIQSELAKQPGEKEFFISAGVGALTGGLTGGTDGAIRGALMGGLESKAVQSKVSSALGNKDYLTKAANVSAVTAIQGGDATAIFSNAAVAAFTAGSVQKAVFGEKPNAFVQNLGNAAVTGGVSAAASGDINQLYYAAGGAVANAIIAETIETAYGAVKGQENLEKHMDDVKFASALVTTGAVILADPQTAVGYSQFLASQTVQKAMIDKFSKKEETGETQSPGDPAQGKEGPDNTQEEIPDGFDENAVPAEGNEKDESGKDDLVHFPDAYDGTGPGLYARLNKKMDDRIYEDLRLPFKTDADISLSQASSKGMEPKMLFASASHAQDLAAYKARKRAQLETRSKAGKTSPKNRKPQMPGKPLPLNDNERLLSMYQAIETVTPREILESKAYNDIAKNKNLAKELLRQELKTVIKNINALYLLRQGYLEKDVESMLSSRNFKKALEKATKNPVITKQISAIVDHALSPQNMQRTLAEMQKRIVAERAYFVELELRKMLWNSERQDIIYSKSKRQNIFLEIYRKIGG